jgi:hypothetical protein
MEYVIIGALSIAALWGWIKAWYHEAEVKDLELDRDSEANLKEANRITKSIPFTIKKIQT